MRLFPSKHEKEIKGVARTEMYGGQQRKEAWAMSPDRNDEASF